jgi:hypothetical protein
MNTKTKNLILTLIVVLIASLIPAIIFGKWLEAIIFLLCHTLIRPQYDLQYHNIIPIICRTITGCVVFFGISFVLPLSMSLLSAIPINYFIGWIGKICAKNNRLELSLERSKYKTIWQMEETELADYLWSKGIRGDKLEFVIMVVIYQMSYEDIAQKLKYSVDTLKDWSPICKQKLIINSWKQDKK